MKVIPILGIDISKRKFDVCLRFLTDTRHSAVFTNDRKGCKALLRWLAIHKADLVHACMESTSRSRYGDDLALFLYQHKHQVSVVNPRCTRNYANSRLTRTQNDRIDAGLIADFCAKENPRLWEPLAANHRHLQDLMRLRDFFVDQKRQCTNRMESQGDSTQAELGRHIRQLENRIKRVEEQVTALLKAHPQLAHAVELLQTIPGVGRITACAALAELPPISQFEHVGSVVAFAGLDPRNKESGDTVSTTPRLSKMGSRLLRKVLYMAALCALRTNPIIRAQTQRLAERGKTGKLAVGAGMRKLLRLIYGVLKSDSPFDPNWQKPRRAVYSSGRASGGDEPSSLQLASPPVAMRNGLASPA